MDKKKKFRTITLLLPLILSSMAVMAVVPVRAQAPTLLLSPSTITVAAGGTFTVELRVTDMPAFNSIDLRVAFDGLALDATALDLTGSMFSTSGLIVFTIFPAPGTVEETPGVVRLAQSVLGGDVSGSGRLAIISFTALTTFTNKALDVGQDGCPALLAQFGTVCDADPSNDQNIIVSSIDLTPIPHTTIDAIVNPDITRPPNFEITSVNVILPGITLEGVTVGTSVNVEVGVKNTGDPSTGTLTVKADGTVLGTAGVTLGAGETRMVTIAVAPTSAGALKINAAGSPCDPSKVTTGVCDTTGTPTGDKPLMVIALLARLAHGKLGWTHHLVQSKTAGMQTFKVTIQQLAGGPATYAQVKITARWTDGSPQTFASMAFLLSDIGCTGAGSVCQTTFTVQVPADKVGMKLSFTAFLLVEEGDVTPDFLSPRTKSGAFAFVL